VIVQTAIATYATTAPFFASLVAGKGLHSLYSFKEIRAIFLATVDRNPFCLLTLGRNQTVARFASSLKSPEQLADPERNFTLTPEAITGDARRHAERWLCSIGIDVHVFQRHTTKSVCFLQFDPTKSRREILSAGFFVHFTDRDALCSHLGR
jgi:hypothetical protein